MSIMGWLRNCKVFKCCSRCASSFWRNSLAEDWIFLALLGVTAAVIGYFMDYVVWKCFLCRMWIYGQVAGLHVGIQYVAWIALPCLFLLTSFCVVTYFAPQAVGSGIPEMKTILWGIQLREYLTFRTGIAKVVGLTTALASGIPLGKEGPLVHIASVIATLLSKLPTRVKDYYNEESKTSEMLAAACAVGLAINFASPVGGVLFSIEVTSSYFPSHNYWRGFVSAVFASLTNRLLVFWLKNEETLTAAYQTEFREDSLFRPEELFVYLLIGVAGGLAGAIFVWIHRNYSLFLKRNKFVSSFLKLNRFIYPTLICIGMGTLYFPPILGDYLLATSTPRQQIFALFSNFSWYGDDLNGNQTELIASWRGAHDNYFLTLGIFMMLTYFLSIVATTLPVPNGSLIPIFRIGAAFGRMVGEVMRMWFPGGLSQFSSNFVPGGYAIVGAAAFTAGVTHSISISVVVCEMTGHIGHIIPVMIAVLTSSAISCLLQPSYFDSMILIKDLPYLPNIRSSRLACKSVVGDFMVRNIKYVWKGMTYSRLKELVDENPRIRVFPLVDSPDSMILLGSITSFELLKLIKKQISDERRMEEVERLRHEARFRSFEESVNTDISFKHKGRKVTLTLPNHSEHRVVCSDVSETNNGKAQTHLETPTLNQLAQALYHCNGMSESQFHDIKHLEAMLDVPSKDEEPLKSEPASSSTGYEKLSERTRCVVALKPITVTNTRRWSTDCETDDSSVDSNKSTNENLQHLKPILKPPSTITTSESKTSLADGESGETNRLMVEHHHRERSNSFLTAMLQINIHKLIRHRKHSLLEDMSTGRRIRWEEREMSKKIDLSQCQIDPAPFQLMESTSLIKVHTIFSLLGMKHAYVTSLGKLIGVFTLKEMREAVEKIKSNTVISRSQLNNTPERSSKSGILRISLRKRKVCMFHGKRIKSPGLRKKTSPTTESSEQQKNEEDCQECRKQNDVQIIVTPGSDSEIV